MYFPPYTERITSDPFTDYTTEQGVIPYPIVPQIFTMERKTLLSSQIAGLESRKEQFLLFTLKENLSVLYRNIKVNDLLGIIHVLPLDPKFTGFRKFKG